MLVDDGSPMADLPRWIPSARVDSMAMLSAFTEFAHGRSEEERRVLALLYLVNHRCPRRVPSPFGLLEPTYVSPGFPMERLCRDADCLRCQEGHGSYTFQWYHPHWGKLYTERARPGSWLPRQDEK